MKTRLIALAVLAASTSVAFAEPLTFVTRARVVGVAPSYSQVAVERNTCYDVPVSSQNVTSGGGAVLGAVIGGVVGNRFGKGSGRALATGAGILGGAIVGNTIEGNRNGSVQGTTRNCTPVTTYEQRETGYNVTYELNGVQGVTHMREFPGSDIPVEVHVSPIAPGTRY